MASVEEDCDIFVSADRILKSGVFGRPLGVGHNATMQEGGLENSNDKNDVGRGSEARVNCGIGNAALPLFPPLLFWHVEEKWGCDWRGSFSARVCFLGRLSCRLRLTRTGQREDEKRASRAALGHRQREKALPILIINQGGNFPPLGFPAFCSTLRPCVLRAVLASIGLSTVRG